MKNVRTQNEFKTDFDLMKDNREKKAFTCGMCKGTEFQQKHHYHHEQTFISNK